MVNLLNLKDTLILKMKENISLKVKIHLIILLLLAWMVAQISDFAVEMFTAP